MKLRILMNFIVMILMASWNKAHSQTVTDFDGNSYNTITIGTQVWMKENLKVAHYQDGTPIPNIKDNTEWSNLTSGARCYFANDSVAYHNLYGSLYNWYAVNNIRKLCPQGWHVPSDAEWNIMEKYLDHTVDINAEQWVGTDIGGKLKEAGTTHWNFPNIGATNSSGFSALPAGGRAFTGIFGSIGELDDWWTSTSHDSVNAWKRYVYFYSAQIERSYFYKTCGWSVRCVKDSLTTQIQGNILNNKVLIYPNPVQDKLFVKSEAKQAELLQIYSAVGICVLQKKCNGVFNEINLDFLSKGIYTLRISGKEWIFQCKLIKQ